MYKKSLYKTNLFLIFGVIAIVISLSGLLLLFSNIIKAELKYQFKKINLSNKSKEKQVLLPVKPVDNNFSVIIPKIDINAKVIPNIDPFNSKEYLDALSKGVAHAKGTSYPTEAGNTFIFAHSTTASIINVNRYNAIFFLLDKIEKEDMIYVVYKGKSYQYKVYNKVIVDPNRVDFLTQKSKRQTLTLMTCWPFGTTLKRLLVFAEKN
ncbi:MAG: sortase [Candidatus Roizmanbacteria bacterium]|nr:MAG: sortase [Candidatus Roizmanbacteria bacterium]